MKKRKSKTSMMLKLSMAFHGSTLMHQPKSTHCPIVPLIHTICPPSESIKWKTIRIEKKKERSKICRCLNLNNCGGTKHLVDTSYSWMSAGDTSRLLPDHFLIMFHRGSLFFIAVFPPHAMLQQWYRPTGARRHYRAPYGR